MDRGIPILVNGLDARNFFRVNWLYVWVLKSQTAIKDVVAVLLPNNTAPSRFEMSEGGK